MNMGQCMANGNGFMCRCPPGFTGQKCDTRDPCTPNPVKKFKMNLDKNLKKIYSSVEMESVLLWELNFSAHVLETFKAQLVPIKILASPIQ